jgi:hypothetical protein
VSVFFLFITAIPLKDRELYPKKFQRNFACGSFCLSRQKALFMREQKNFFLQTSIFSTPSCDYLKRAPDVRALLSKKTKREKNVSHKQRSLQKK